MSTVPRLLDNKSGTVERDAWCVPLGSGSRKDTIHRSTVLNDPLYAGSCPVLLNGIAIIVAAYFVPGVVLAGPGTALIAGLILGGVNVLVRPGASGTTFPLTLVTLGLFIFVVNALCSRADGGAGARLRDHGLLVDVVWCARGQRRQLGTERIDARSDRPQGRALSEGEGLIDTESFRPRAVVFDLDGTLADNMHWHARAFQAFVTRHGLPPLSEATRRRIDGKRNAEIMPILFDWPLSADEPRHSPGKRKRCTGHSRAGALQPIRGLTALLDALADVTDPAGVATSAPRENVAHTLGELGLVDRFGAVAFSDEVPRGKPYPDVYLRAAEALGVEASVCLAFEDAPVGVTAARAAGMRCWRVDLHVSRRGVPH